MRESFLLSLQMVTSNWFPIGTQIYTIINRLDVRVKPLFSVDVIIERKSNTKIEFLVKAKSNFKPKSTANNVEVNSY